MPATTKKPEQHPHDCFDDGHVRILLRKQNPSWHRFIPIAHEGHLHRVRTFEARNVGDWRRWLARHHASESEVWLIFYKQHTGEATVSYKDALDEALCFGWIDSLIRRLDDDRYARKFTPRKADSRWSDINRKRYGELKAAGRLKRAGIDRAPTDRRYEQRRSLQLALPKYIRDGLQEYPSAWRQFERLAPSHRRHYVGWIDLPKRPETRARRLTEAIRLLEAGKPLGLK